MDEHENVYTRMSKLVGEEHQQGRGKGMENGIRSCLIFFYLTFYQSGSQVFYK